MAEERFSPFPSGLLEVNGIHAINPTVSLEDAAAAATRLNTKKQLTHIVDQQHVLYRQYMHGSERLSFVVPSAPYTDFAVMLVAHNEPLKGGSDGEPIRGEDTQYIYRDFSSQVQREWWRSIVSGLRALEGATGGSDSTHHNLYVENCTPVTNYQQRTSRTILLPHGHFISIDEGHVKPDPEPLDHVRAEQSFLGLTDFTQNSIIQLREKLGVLGLDVKLKEITNHPVEPFGYRMRLEDHDFDGLSEFMRVHHELYTTITEAYFMKDPNIAPNVIPQPAYRLYAYIDKRAPHLISVLISPELFSHGGVLEAVGIRLIRSEDAPKRLTQERLTELRSLFVEGVKATETQPTEASGPPLQASTQ